MRKIIYAQMVSLDGFMEGPGGDLGWSEPGEELHQHFNDMYLAFIAPVPLPYLEFC
ncbi:MAG: hypothetical protein WD266_10845 [Balneolales bacterium]